MSQLNINSFIHDFFTGNECDVHIPENDMIQIQLTEEIDRAIMNRPFYWHYVKATGQTGEPQRLTFVTNIDKSHDQGEWIHFGTPRMNEICHYLEQSSRFIQAFEQVHVEKQTLLHPWLVINITISFKGMQVREETLSIGLNLINGTMINGMMETLETKELDHFISPHCYTITPIIKMKSGLRRIEQYVDSYVEQQDYQWALESILLLKDELLLLKHFYENNEQKDDLIKEVNQLYYRLRPEVSYTVINGGIVYLSENIYH